MKIKVSQAISALEETLEILTCKINLPISRIHFLPISMFIVRGAWNHSNDFGEDLLPEHTY